MNGRFKFLLISSALLISGCATSTLLTAPNTPPPANEEKRLVDRPGVVPALLPFAVALDLVTAPLVPINLAIYEATHAPSRPTALDEKSVLAIARREVARRASWPHGGEFTATRRKDGWVVTAWRIVYPNNQGSARFVPDGFVSIFIDQSGKVTRYSGAP